MDPKSSNGNAPFMSKPSTTTILVTIIGILLTTIGMNKWVGSDLASHETKAAVKFEKVDRTEKDVAKFQKSLDRIEDKIDKINHK